MGENSASRAVLEKDPLPKYKKSTFVVRIEYTETKNQSRRIMIGIRTSSMKNSSINFSEGIGSFTYNSNRNGWIYQHGLAQYDGKSQQPMHHHKIIGGNNIVMKQFQKYDGVTGTIIKVTIDLPKAGVSFYYNDEFISTLPLDKALTQHYDYYSFLEMSSKYDRVSFVSFTTDS